MTERAAADAFVKAALETSLAGMGLSVYADMAPDGTLPPYVVFGGTTGPPVETNGSLLLVSEFTYTVRATYLGNVSAVDPAEEAIQNALAGTRSGGNRQGVTATQNGFYFNSKGAGALSSLTTQQGLNFRYAGGRFLIRVRPYPAP